MSTRTKRVLICMIMLLSLCGCTNDKDVPEAQIPAAYKVILSDYDKVLTYRLADTFESDYNNGKDVILSDALTKSMTDELEYRWHCMLVEMVSGLNDPKKDDFGYVLKDINEDGTPELFWVRKDYTILAVFTIQNDQAQLIDAFWPKYKGTVSGAGELYTIGSSGAAYSEYKIWHIPTDGSELTSVKEFGIDGSEYYEMVDGKKQTVSEERFKELLTDYPFEENTDWEIVPLD